MRTFLDALRKKPRFPVYGIQELIARSQDIDILFDLAGSPAVRQELREGLAAIHNQRMVIAPESVARMI